MKLSEKRQQEVYNAIADPITDLRMDYRRMGVPQGSALDTKLFNLQSEIWRRVHKALNLEGPP